MYSICSMYITRMISKIWQLKQFHKVFILWGRCNFFRICFFFFFSHIFYISRASVEIWKCCSRSLAWQLDQVRVMQQFTEAFTWCLKNKFRIKLSVDCVSRYSVHNSKFSLFIILFIVVKIHWEEKLESETILLHDFLYILTKQEELK